VGIRLPRRNNHGFFLGRFIPPRTTQDTLDIDMHAVWYHNAGIQTLPVGGKLPNAWDLYDIVGNLWEWANDWDAPYSPDPQIDPVGPATGTSRIVRGGTWSVYDDDRHLRSGARNGGYHPYDRGYLTGFRIVQR
jgi:formylglycine-generating enzyme required for sulfatase activity